MNKLIGTLIAFVLIVLGGVTLIGKNNVTTLGSTTVGNEYHATTTYTKLGTPLFGTTQTIIDNTQGTLGSVVITGAVAGSMRFMNATSTTDISSTTIAVFPASAAVGTYVFDLVISRGLILETTANLVPTTTITYR